MKGLAVDLVILNEQAHSYAQDLQASLETLVRTSQSTLRHERHETPRERLRPPRRLAVGRRPRRPQHRGARRPAEPPRHARRAGRARGAPEPARRARPAARPLGRSRARGAAASARARVLQRPGRLRRRRARVRHRARRGAVDAGALDQRRREPALRLSGLGVRGRVHVVGQQPREPADALVERSRQRSAGRGDLRPRRGDAATSGARPRCRSARRPGPTSRATARATAGSSTSSHGIALELLQFVPLEDPVKISRLTIENRSGRTRRLSVTAYVEWVLGRSRSAAAPFIVTERRRGDRRAAGAQRLEPRLRGPRRVRRPRRPPDRVDRRPDARSSAATGPSTIPAALERGDRLSGRVGRRPRSRARRSRPRSSSRPAGAPRSCSCSARRRRVEEARALIARYRAADLDARPARGDDALGRHPRRRAGEDARPLDGPDAQPVAALPDARLPGVGPRRLLPGRRRLRIPRPAPGRHGPDRGRRARSRASTCCGPRPGSSWRATSSTGGIRPSGRGVRTRISDDRDLAAVRRRALLEVTGDAAVLDEVVPFLDGPPLARRSSTKPYFQPTVSAERGTLFEHCARALDRSLAVGAHGLPLIGTGDWNDGMNRVGLEGRGRERLARLVPPHGAVGVRAAGRRARRGDARARALAAPRAAPQGGPRAARLGRRLVSPRLLRRRHAARLGRERRVPDRLDRAVVGRCSRGRPSPPRAARAMAAVEEYLVRREPGAGPAVHAAVRPRRRSIPATSRATRPGVRENGGQYTHAAIWAVMAFAALGDGDKAGELFSILNPINHASTRAGRPPLQGGALRRRRRTSMPSRRTSAAAAGPGTRARPAGCTAPGVEWILGFRLRGADAAPRSVHPPRVAALRDRVPIPLLALRDHGREPERA